MAQLLLSLQKEIELIEVDENQVKLRFPHFEFSLAWSLGGREVLRRLATTGITDDDIKATIIQFDGVGGVFKFSSQFARLVNQGYICQTLAVDGQALAYLQPFGATYRGHSGNVAPDQLYTLSRFAFLHKEGDYLALECPLGAARLLFMNPQLVTLIALFSTPQSLQTLANQLPALSMETIQRFQKMLLNLKSLSAVDEAGKAAEDDHPALAVWDFHDLVFHSRSRIGRYDKPYIGEFRFMGKHPLPPMVKPDMSETTIELFQPDLTRLSLEDMPFSQVLENRHTSYEYAESPLTLNQLGEFLYRVARIKGSIKENLQNQAGLTEVVEYSQRPYPSGGALYELELYLTVHQCEGLEAGLYHYHPLKHHLEFLKPLDNSLTMLLKDAERAMMQGQKPNILITLAARYQRIAWKYNTLAYSLIQKNVGVVYQTMYLVATAMNLAPCAIGAGNSDLFAEVTGLDYLVEGSVGDFALSSQKMPTESLGK